MSWFDLKERGRDFSSKWVEGCVEAHLEHIVFLKKQKECVRKDGLGKKTTNRSNPPKGKELFFASKRFGSVRFCLQKNVPPKKDYIVLARDSGPKIFHGAMSSSG